MFTIQSIRRFSCAAIAVTALAACDSSSTGPSATTTLVVENSSAQPIIVVNFGSCSDPSWGPDRLGSTETIAVGAERSWTIQPGCYDVRAKTASGSKVWLDIEVEAGKSARLKALSFSASISTAETSEGQK